MQSKVSNDSQSFTLSQETFLHNIPDFLRDEVKNQLHALNDAKDSSTSSKAKRHQQQFLSIPKVNSSNQQQRTHQTKITHLFKAEEVKQGGHLDADEWHALLKNIEEQEAITKLSSKKIHDNKSATANTVVNAITPSITSINYKFQRESMILVGQSLIEWMRTCH
jgi:hypothetical protein